MLEGDHASPFIMGTIQITKKKARNYMSQNTIIVTGGAGFIGSNFIFHTLHKYPDYRIVCLDCLTYAGNLSTLAPVMDKPNFRFVKESITDREAVYRLFEEEHPDMVVNFAAESHVDRSIENPQIFLDTNIIGTSVLMDACRKYGIKRYHQVSQNLRTSGNHQPVFQQLRTLSLPGEADSLDDRQRIKRQASAGVRKRGKCARLAVCGRSLQSH